jgi:hypothetical protein
MTFRWRSNTKKWQIWLNLHGTILEGKSIGSDFFLKDLNGELMIWRTQMQVRVQAMVQFKDSVCYKLVQIGSSEFQPWTPSKVGLSATLDKGSGTKSPRTNLKQIEPWMGPFFTLKITLFSKVQWVCLKARDPIRGFNIENVWSIRLICDLFFLFLMVFFFFFLNFILKMNSY